MTFFFFFKQKTAYEMRISDWSSDVCSSDLSSVLRDRLEALVEGAREELRKERIGYTNLGIAGTNTVGLKLRDPSQADRARELLAKLGQPIQGGAFSLGATPSDMTVDIAAEDRKSTRLNSSH